MGDSTSKLMNNKSSLMSRIISNKAMYFLLLPAFLLTLVFSYLPMLGIIVSFKDFDMFSGNTPLDALINSPWASEFGLKYFIEIFKTPDIVDAIVNTLEISVLTLIVLFPASILLAVAINELKSGIYKKTIQTVSYLPHFLAMIAVVGIFQSFLATDGALNSIIQFVSGGSIPKIMFLSKQEMFIPSIILITVWKSIGWNSIVFLAAIAGVDCSLYEAAEIDGAGRLMQIKKILIPSILPTISVLLILNMATLFSSNFELIFAMQNPYQKIETIETMVYKTGLQNGNYSLSTAIGFMNGIVSIILVFITNKISKKVSGNSLW